MTTVILLTVAIFAMAILYSSVGHAGASGYIAAMAIVTTMPQEDMKAVALTLNIFVAGAGSWRFIRAGHFDWKLFWPFAVCAVPFAFIGGMWKLPAIVFNPLIGVVLLYAACVLGLRVLKANNGTSSESTHVRPHLATALTAGGGLGLLAGLTGTGGGIFLSPLLLMRNWASPQRTAAISIVFVLVNSIAGLGGVIADSPSLPASLPIYIIGALAGGLIGSSLGANKLPGNKIRLLLSLVLIIAAVKMFITAFAS
ncbi:MAG: sulfite exporter TauE/SafE family protein [Phycisphaerales bacterium]|nr:sulfite exporter TauE/SafE family protein [Phycisphaerales bacterium]